MDKQLKSSMIRDQNKILLKNCKKKIKYCFYWQNYQKQYQKEITKLKRHENTKSEQFSTSAAHFWSDQPDC